MSYPVAYRRNASAPARGSRTSPGRSVPRQPPLSPANDNWPAPANDNKPRRRVPRNQQAAAGFGRRAAPYVRGALRVGRLHPAVGRFIDVAQLVGGYYDRRVAEAMQYGGMMLNTTGYVRLLNCNGGGAGTHVSNLNGWGASCGVAAPFVAADANMTCPPNPSEFFTWRYEAPYITPGFSTYWRLEKWRWDGSTNPVPGVRYTRNVNLGPLPVVTPMMDPMSAPMFRPLGAPEPVPWSMLPYRRVNPYRSPTERHDFGYQPWTGTWRRPYRWYMGVGSRPGPGMRPSPRPRPGGRPKPGVGPLPKPPGPGKHERKSTLRRGMMAALNAARTATEAIDAIDAVFEALPAKYRKGAKTPQEKLYRIWKHYKHLDMNKVVLNLVANHLIDKVVGRASGRSDAIIKRITGHHATPSIWA